MVTKHNHLLTQVTISFSNEIASGIYLFGFTREFDFQAGQVIGIALREDGPRRL